MTDVRAHLTSDPRFQQVPTRNLLSHGFLLHAASLLGPLRASSAFRASNKHWFKIVLARVWQEYGLNLMLLAVGFLNVIVLTDTPTARLVGVALVLAGVPALTCLQMLIDKIRGDLVLKDTTIRSSGISIRVEQIRGVQVVRFFNHYGLPIGRGHGVALRSWLLRTSKERDRVLVCRAQSETVADYYLSVHPGGMKLSGAKRPLLMWDHTLEGSGLTAADFGEKRGGLGKALIGWHNTRGSGQGF